MEYRIEKITPEKIGDLLGLYKITFGKTVTSEYLHKKLNTSFAKTSFVGFIAYDRDDIPSAFYGAYPCHAIYKNEKYLIAQSGDTMTHPSHQGKGLFTLLAKKTFEYCKESGINLIFGFPNENSYPGFIKKLDWVHFDNIEAYLIKADSKLIAKLKNLLGINRNFNYVKAKQILNSLPKAKPFNSSCQSLDVTVVDHSPEFFNYKTYEENFLVSIDGISVWLKISDKFLLIGDIEKTTDEQFIKTINSLKKIAKQMGVTYLRHQGSTGTWLTELFQKHGKKMEVKYAIAGIQFTDKIPLAMMKFTAADNDTF